MQNRWAIKRFGPVQRQCLPNSTAVPYGIKGEGAKRPSSALARHGATPSCRSSIPRFGCQVGAQAPCRFGTRSQPVAQVRFAQPCCAGQSVLFPAASGAYRSGYAVNSAHAGKAVKTLMSSCVARWHSYENP